MTTDNEELMIAQTDKDIKASCAGGEYGSVIIFEFLDQFEVKLNYNRNLWRKNTQ